MACCGGGGVKDDKFSSFGDACYTGNVEKMKEQLKKGGKDTDKTVNATNEDGMSPLHRAAQNGNTEVIKFLIDNNANPRVTSKSGETPLHVAAFHRNKDAMAALLKTAAKEDINSQDKQHGMTPVHVAVYRGSPAIADMLLTAGADPTIPDKYGQNALEMAKFWEEQEKAGLSSPTAQHAATLSLLQKRMN
eukprot:Polyplicarium_translucidae@DN1709_c0_g1_i1.p1